MVSAVVFSRALSAISSALASGRPSLRAQRRKDLGVPASRHDDGHISVPAGQSNSLLPGSLIRCFCARRIFGLCAFHLPPLLWNAARPAAILGNFPCPF